MPYYKDITVSVSGILMLDHIIVSSLPFRSHSFSPSHQGANLRVTIESNAGNPADIPCVASQRKNHEAWRIENLNFLIAFQLNPTLYMQRIPCLLEYFFEEKDRCSFFRS